ncbi:hypothetical protein CEN40_09125 [Fischerella thermalis CCMEE 5205]|nr:hypothetical protein CEN40_09125 [Fischerella thermalis CCMEE 5205]
MHFDLLVIAFLNRIGLFGFQLPLDIYFVKFLSGESNTKELAKFISISFVAIQRKNCILVNAIF